MKLKFVLLTIILFTFSASMYAATLPDSVGVENLNGKKVILHKLDPKDNYYSIGRRYGVSPKTIMQFNNNASLQIGHIIKVPTERSIVETVAAAPVVKPATQPAVTTAQPPVTQQPVKTDEQKPAATPASTATSQQYKVSAGETLYSIAKRFNTSVGEITALNKLNSTGLTPGQVLIVPNGATPPPVIEAPIDTTRRDSTLVVADSLANHRPGTNRYGLFEKNEKGAATWIDDTSLDPNKKLILHRTAPIGTVMKITNPMNGRSTFAKVVGRFADNQSTKDVIIVMTKNVAESLGALDKRFHVNISYGTPNE
jgi:LysM repeat protein